jgi:hypothetical protein
MRHLGPCKRTLSLGRQRRQPGCKLTRRKAVDHLNRISGRPNLPRFEITWQHNQQKIRQQEMGQRREGNRAGKAASVAVCCGLGFRGHHACARWLPAVVRRRELR